MNTYIICLLTALESVVYNLLLAMGFEENASITGQSHDGGVDVVGTLVVGGVIRIRMAVQAKKWKKNVGIEIVQRLRGNPDAIHRERMIITTSDFTSDARKDAHEPHSPIWLINGTRLVDLLIEHSIGVKTEPYSLLEIEKI